MLRQVKQLVHVCMYRHTYIPMYPGYLYFCELILTVFMLVNQDISIFVTIPVVHTTNFDISQGRGQCFKGWCNVEC